MLLRQRLAACYARLVCRLPGLHDLLEEMYVRGYADGRAAEHTALLHEFAVLERTTPPLLH
jgi:hypothetical protein